jgi:crotonobetainyl-CoA:carnitine CoA-transferase CaiB-like acyl-CoA transferase
MNKILDDLLVIELASVLAGPLAGSFMAELGARVVKIENSKIGGDVTRQWKHPSEDADSTISAYYASANIGKGILPLDLGNPDDYQKLVSLIEKADVVISNFQKVTAEKLNINHEKIISINPQIIFAQLSAYSYEDPRPGYDLIMQAETGFLSMTGIEDSIAKMPVALIDVIAGHQIKEAILLGVITRMKTGKGSYFEISLYKSAISGLANQASNYLMNNHVPGPMGTLHPNIAPYGDIMVTNDEISVLLAVGSDKQFEKLVKTLNLADKLLHTFNLNKDRVDRRKELNTYLMTACNKLSYQELSSKLTRAQIPFCRVTKMDKVFATPLAIEMIIKETIEGNQTSKVSNIAFDMKIN